LRLLLAEDDPELAGRLKHYLGRQGFAVDAVDNGVDAEFNACEIPYDVIVLDLGLPQRSGLEVLSNWRRSRMQAPVLILTARDTWQEKVQGLQKGADDYLTKPFGIAELMARIKTAFRHRGDPAVAPAQPNFICGDMEINFAKRRVTVGGKEVALTPTEYAMLQHLAVNSDKVLTHSMLLESVWGSEYSSEKEYLRVFVGRLRRKLEPDPKNPRYIQTIPGVGYHLTTTK